MNKLIIDRIDFCYRVISHICSKERDLPLGKYNLSGVSEIKMVAVAELPNTKLKYDTFVCNVACDPHSLLNTASDYANHCWLAGYWARAQSDHGAVFGTMNSFLLYYVHIDFFQMIVDFQDPFDSSSRCAEHARVHYLLGLIDELNEVECASKDGLCSALCHECKYNRNHT